MNCGFQVSSCLQPVWLFLLLQFCFFGLSLFKKSDIGGSFFYGDFHCNLCWNKVIGTCQESHRHWHLFCHHSFHLWEHITISLGAHENFCDLFYKSNLSIGIIYQHQHQDTRHFKSQPDISIKWSFRRLLWLESRIRGGTCNLSSSSSNLKRVLKVIFWLSANYMGWTIINGFNPSQNRGYWLLQIPVV